MGTMKSAIILCLLSMLNVQAMNIPGKNRAIRSVTESLLSSRQSDDSKTYFTQLFSQVDGDGDQSVTLAEFIKANPKDQAQATVFFENADINNDNVVDKSEWVAAQEKQIAQQQVSGAVEILVRLIIKALTQWLL